MTNTAAAVSVPIRVSALIIVQGMPFRQHNDQLATMLRCWQLKWFMMQCPYFCCDGTCKRQALASLGSAATLHALTAAISLLTGPSWLNLSCCLKPETGQCSHACAQVIQQQWPCAGHHGSKRQPGTPVGMCLTQAFRRQQVSLSLTWGMLCMQSTAAAAPSPSGASPVKAGGFKLPAALARAVVPTAPVIVQAANPNAVHPPPTSDPLSSPSASDGTSDLQQGTVPAMAPASGPSQGSSALTSPAAAPDSGMIHSTSPGSVIGPAASPQPSGPPQESDISLPPASSPRALPPPARPSAPPPPSSIISASVSTLMSCHSLFRPVLSHNP